MSDPAPIRFRFNSDSIPIRLRFESGLTLLWAPLLNGRYNMIKKILQLYRRKSDTICRTDAHKSSHNEGIPTKNHNPSPPKQRCGQKRGGIRSKSDSKPRKVYYYMQYACLVNVVISAKVHFGSKLELGLLGKQWAPARSRRSQAILRRNM